MMTLRSRTVGAILGQLCLARPVRKTELSCGDRLLVVTENSVYSITALEGSIYRVRGGWFDKQGLSPATTSIAGCTWGGSVIKVDIVAAHGLRLEFGNRVLTSRIRSVHVIRAGADSDCRFRPFDFQELLLACYGPRWSVVSAA
jgi:hypothetical protein